ncbi:MAG: hypothetical protein UIH27_07045 [Ruminococcus sp.]|nr:hypothetical protein [Ruminococcus sp.]
MEKSPSATQHCSLSGRFLGYSLREFGLRRPLEMTYIGNPRPKFSTFNFQLKNGGQGAILTAFKQFISKYC